MLDDFFNSKKNSKLFRLFFGSPDMDYRGVTTEEEDEAFDRLMNVFGVTSLIALLAVVLFK